MTEVGSIVPLLHWIEGQRHASRLINCPFEVWKKKTIDGCWKLEMKNISHNHEPSSDMSGHLYFRRLSKEDMLSIKG